MTLIYGKVSIMGKFMQINLKKIDKKFIILGVVVFVLLLVIVLLMVFKKTEKTTNQNISNVTTPIVAKTVEGTIDLSNKNSSVNIVKNGQQFMVPISIDTVAGVDGAEVYLCYDSKQVDLVDKSKLENNVKTINGSNASLVLAKVKTKTNKNCFDVTLVALTGKIINPAANVSFIVVGKSGNGSINIDTDKSKIVQVGVDLVTIKTAGSFDYTISK